MNLSRYNIDVVTRNPLERFAKSRSIIKTPKAGYRYANDLYVIDFIFRVFRVTGTTILKLNIVPTLLLISGFIFLGNGVLAKLTQTNTPNSLSQQILEFWGNVAVGVFIALPIIIISLAWIISIANVCVSDLIMNRSHPETNISRRSLANLPKCLAALLFLEFWTIALVLVGFLLAGLATLTSGITGTLLSWFAAVVIFCGVIWFIYFQATGSFVPIIAMNEHLSTIKCLKRSKKLSKGQKGLGESSIIIIFGFVFSIIIVYFVLLAGCQYPLQYLDVAQYVNQSIHNPHTLTLILALIDILPNAIVLWVLSALISTGIVTIYYEARIRFEGLDIEILAEEMKLEQKGEDTGFII